MLQQVKKVQRDAAAEWGLMTSAAANKPEEWKAATESAVLQQWLVREASVEVEQQVAQVKASCIQWLSRWHACWHEQEQRQQVLVTRQGEAKRRRCRALHRSRQAELVERQKRRHARFHEAASHLGWAQWCCHAWREVQLHWSSVAAGRRRRAAASHLERRRGRVRQRRPLRGCKLLALHDGDVNVDAAACGREQHAPWGSLLAPSRTSSAAGGRPSAQRPTGTHTGTHHHCRIDKRALMKAAAAAAPGDALLESARASSWEGCPATRGSSPPEASAASRSCSCVPAAWMQPTEEVCRVAGPSTLAYNSAQQQTAAAQVSQLLRSGVLLYGQHRAPRAATRAVGPACCCPTIPKGTGSPIPFDYTAHADFNGGLRSRFPHLPSWL